jgi:hypothetical protein
MHRIGSTEALHFYSSSYTPHTTQLLHPMPPIDASWYPTLRIHRPTFHRRVSTPRAPLPRARVIPVPRPILLPLEVVRPGPMCRLGRFPPCSPRAALALREHRERPLPLALGLWWPTCRCTRGRTGWCGARLRRQLLRDGREWVLADLGFGIHPPARQLCGISVSSPIARAPPLGLLARLLDMP